MPPKEQQQREPQREGPRLENLEPQQLQELRESINGDIQKLGEGMQALGRAANTFASTRRAVDDLGTSREGQAILLPLTSSLYVPGEIADVEKVMVDVGTGYYVEMTIDAAKDYCERRSKRLYDDIQSISSNLRERQNMLMHVQALLAEKMQAVQAQQRQGSAVAKA